MSIEDGDTPQRPKIAQWEKEAKARQAAQSRSRSAISAKSWPPQSLEEHLKNGQVDLVANGTLVLPPNPRPGSNLPTIRDVHSPIWQLDRLILDLEQTGVIDRPAFERMAEILSVIYRGDRDPTWGESRRILERFCRAVGQSEPEEKQHSNKGSAISAEPQSKGDRNDE
jgi:hypothetical protein